MRFKYLILFLGLLVFCSCMQQDKTVQKSNIVLLKYVSTDNDLSSAQNFYLALEKSAKKNHKTLEVKELDRNYTFESEIQNQIKDFGRKFIFINTRFPEDKLVLIAKQNPSVFFILMDCDKNFNLANVKSIAFDRKDMIKDLAFISAYWADNKDPNKPAVSFYTSPDSKYFELFPNFKEGIDFYNQTYNKNVALSKVSITSKLTEDQIDKQLEKSIKDNNSVYFITLEQDYYQYLKKIQTKGKYSLGLEFDMYYNKPEFQDVVIISGVIDYTKIAEDLIKSIDNGSLNSTQLMANYSNGLVTISPFHNFDNQISNKIKTEITFR